MELEELYRKQLEYQKQLIDIEYLPKDEVQWFQYHITALSEETGEILKADKRWKTHRNAFYNLEMKLEELADMFITLINLALFSGIECSELIKAIDIKISVNEKKIERGE